MATTVRPEVSKKNPYYIDRERYYELKHFCRQYPIWKKAYNALDGLSRRPADLELFNNPSRTSDPTARCAEARAFYSQRMEMVEQCAREADPKLYKYIMSYVTKGDAYAVLKMRDHIPCCKDVFYEVARKFFWLLNNKEEKVIKTIVKGPGMSPNEYQQLALRTASKESIEKPLLNGLLGLGGETGECQDLYKKHLFQGHELDKDQMAKELGDVSWYLALTAYAIGYNLEDIFRINIEKLQDRYPNGFDVDHSLHRKPGDV